MALVIPTVELGAYWKPVLTALGAHRVVTRLFTAMPWRGIDRGDLAPEGPVTVVGRKRRVGASDPDSDYGGGVMVLSPGLAGHLWRYRPHVVVVSGFSAWSMLVLALRPLGRWRVVLLWEGSSPRVDHRTDRWRTLQRRAVCASADAILTNSSGGAQYLVGHLGMPSAKVTEAPYMVPDPATLGPAATGHPPDEHVEVLCVGRWEERKGIRTLIRAVAALPDDLGDRVRVRLIGAGPEEDVLRAEVARAGLEEQVEFVGWVPYDALGDHLRAADLLAFLTHEDTWGMVALEAMAVGTPVLCSSRAGAHVLVDDALVVDPHDVGAVAGALEDLVADPDRLVDLGRGAATRMGSHTPDQAAARLMQAARRAVAARGLSGST